MIIDTNVNTIPMLSLPWPIGRRGMYLLLLMTTTIYIYVCVLPTVYTDSSTARFASRFEAPAQLSRRLSRHSPVPPLAIVVEEWAGQTRRFLGDGYRTND